MLFLSIIIPTFRDWERLRVCLDSLTSQMNPSIGTEIVVVNNDPLSPIPEWVSMCPQTKCVTESEPGSYAARNCGALLAKGSVLAFTDSDCIPESSWLENVEATFKGNRTRLVSGKVLVNPRDSRRIGSVEAYDMAVGIRQDIYAKKGTGATANLICTREAFDLVNGFDSSRMSGGDTDFCKRLRAKGVNLEYVPSIEVAHPARSSWSEVSNKARRLAGSRAFTTGKEFRRFFLAILLPPLVRAKLIITCKRLSLKDRTLALGVLIALKAVQFLEFFSVLLFKKDRVR